ncbi:MAG: ABC transporter ATP-binding protein [Vulcanimicrobiaceae bacterium]
MSALRIEDLTVRYGGVVALDAVNITIASGSIVGLIGPNGAGKTSLVNAVTGVVRPQRGTIVLGMRRLDGLAQHAVARAGIARTYQNVRLFANLGVADNVRAGALARSRTLDRSHVLELLARTGLRDADLERRAGTLAYGDQRRLEIARALAAEPAIVLLDEPAAGMNPHETHALRELVVAVARAGVGVLLIEHDMSLVRAVCQRVVVLDFGRPIAEGTPDEIARDPAVVEAYLGA